MLSKRFSGGMLLILLLILSAMSYAQESTVRGNLGGIVSDKTGAVVPGAKVTITGPTGTNTMNSGPEGRFFFGVLIPGTYGVRVEKEGFRTAELKAVDVATGRTSSVSIVLEPGAVTETVEVSATAVTVDTASTAVGQNLNDTFYSRVPVARNVTGLFYASPGVNQGGGTGAANPSISGGSGLENQYVADGVNITDGAFGGIGVYTVNYGSLSTGINLSFVKEVQVKTAGYEPQYGKSTGGLVQIVTKSGSNTFHGGVSAFFGPQQFEAARLNPDDFGRLNEQGRLLHQGSYDVSGEIGGYVPGMKDRLFFFGSFNPSWTRQYNRLADLHGTFSFPLVNAKNSLNQLAYNYAGKLTLRLSDKHQIESSIFGDPTRSNTGPFQTLETFSSTTYSKLANGTRNWVARYNGTLSPTWLFNASYSWGHNYLTETPNAPGIYQVSDFTGCGVPPSSATASGCRTRLIGNTLNGPLGTPLSGIFVRQGLGFFENTEGDNHALNFDTQKIVNALGSHAFSVGYHYEWSSYGGARFRSGPRFTITPQMATDMNFPAAAGQTSNAAGFSIRITSATACPQCPLLSIPGIGDRPVILRQVRGEFGDPSFDTHGRYHAAYVNDSWTPSRHVTMNIGWRWEQQLLQGTPFVNPINGRQEHTHYTFTDNWSPRIGLSIDPKGDRKTKVFGNFARYSYAIPLDLAIRSLSNELDFATAQWLPPSSGGRVIVNPDGTIANPILDQAHFAGALSGVSLSVNPDGSVETIAPGTKMQYLQEWVAGVEHEFPKGVVVNVRWIDRRIKRIVEDIAGISPEAFQAGQSQIYTISNPNSGTDLFINPIQVDHPAGFLQFDANGVPTNCDAGSPIGVEVVDTFNNDLGGVCITNPAVAGILGKDGKLDGFVNPVRVYKAIEFEVNKAFSSGWQLRTNYRWSQLLGNYEGAFRNDNGQSDPNISSLFDFVRGDFNLLGNQFDPGWLNTDRRHIINNFLSYTFSSGFLKNLTLGTGVRIETGVPINDLKAHPAYQNAGEIPVGGRGVLGRTPTTGQADIHSDYAWKVNERHTVHFGADLFNITNQTTQLRVDQNEDRQFQVTNADFKKPTQGNVGFSPVLGFQRPFYARLFAKWVF